jgi:hypothetical protein
MICIDGTNTAGGVNRRRRISRGRKCRRTEHKALSTSSSPLPNIVLPGPLLSPISGRSFALTTSFNSNNSDSSPSTSSCPPSSAPSLNYASSLGAVRRPCTGITSNLEPLVSQYLIRSGATGAGAPHVQVVTAELFPGATFANLDDDQHRTVRLEQSHQRTWINNHGLQAVFSTSCTCTATPSCLDSHKLCPSCRSLLRDRRLRKALNCKVPDKEAFKFNNHAYRNKALGGIFAKSSKLREILDEVNFVYFALSTFTDLLTQSFAGSPAFRYAQGVYHGDYQGQPVFTDMIAAMQELEDRNKQGVGRQNFRYGASLDRFAQEIFTFSPLLYKSIAKTLPLCSESSARYVIFPVLLVLLLMESLRNKKSKAPC